MSKKLSFITVFLCAFMIGLTVFVAYPNTSQAEEIPYCWSPGVTCKSHVICDPDACEGIQSKRTVWTGFPFLGNPCYPCYSFRGCVYECVGI